MICIFANQINFDPCQRDLAAPLVTRDASPPYGNKVAMKASISFAKNFTTTIAIGDRIKTVTNIT